MQVASLSMQSNTCGGGHGRSAECSQLQSRSRTHHGTLMAHWGGLQALPAFNQGAGELLSWKQLLRMIRSGGWRGKGAQVLVHGLRRMLRSTERTCPFYAART